MKNETNIIIYSRFHGSIFISALLRDVETQILDEEAEDNDNCREDATGLIEDSGKKNASSQVSLHSAKTADLVASKSNDGELSYNLDVPVTSLDEKLKRLSWHSSMTSYVAWRLASPYIHSPCSTPCLERRNCPSNEPAAV